MSLSKPLPCKFHDRDEVLRVALIPNPVFNEMWFLTIDPFIRVSVFIASSPSDNTAGVFSRTFIVKKKNLFFDIHNCLFMRLHFSIGGYDYRRTTRFRRSIHFSITRVLFADHVHRRSRVYNKFSFLKLRLRCHRRLMCQNTEFYVKPCRSPTSISAPPVTLCRIWRVSCRSRTPRSRSRTAPSNLHSDNRAILVAEIRDQEQIHQTPMALIPRELGNSRSRCDKPSHKN